MCLTRGEGGGFNPSSFSTMTPNILIWGRYQGIGCFLSKHEPVGNGYSLPDQVHAIRVTPVTVYCGPTHSLGRVDRIPICGILWPVEECDGVCENASKCPQWWTCLVIWDRIIEFGFFHTHTPCYHKLAIFSSFPTIPFPSFHPSFLSLPPSLTLLPISFAFLLLHTPLTYRLLIWLLV